MAASNGIKCVSTCACKQTAYLVKIAMPYTEIPTDDLSGFL